MATGPTRSADVQSPPTELPPTPDNDHRKTSKKTKQKKKQVQGLFLEFYGMFFKRGLKSPNVCYFYSCDLHLQYIIIFICFMVPFKKALLN